MQIVSTHKEKQCKREKYTRANYLLMKLPSEIMGNHGKRKNVSQFRLTVITRIFRKLLSSFFEGFCLLVSDRVSLL